MASFRRMPCGSWQAIVRRKGYRPQFHTFESRQDAQQWARSIESDIDRAVFVDRGPSERITIDKLIDRYIDEILPDKKSARSLTACLRYLQPHFAAYTLATLQTKDVAAYRDARLAGGTAGATVVKELNTLSRVIDMAASEWGYFIAVNPVKQTRRPPVARGRERRLTPAEETKLIAACENSRAPMLKGIVILALETGMRLGELLALTWDTLDLAKRTARLVDTKNGDSRTVPLSTVAVAALGKLPRHITHRRVFWPWSRPDSFENAWRRAVENAEIEDLRFHDLRHEAVSRLFERGLNMLEVAAISGHKTLQMLKRYTHLKAEELACKLG